MKKKIALLTTAWSYEYVFSIIDGIKKAIDKEEIDLYLFLCYGYSDETAAYNIGEYNIFNLIDYRDYDGVILFANIFNSLEVLEREVARIRACNIPAVCLEYEVDGVDYLGTDNYSGMHEIVEHLLKDHGIRNLAYIGGPDDNIESQERRRAFEDTLKEYQIEIDPKRCFFNGDWSYDFAFAVAGRMVKDAKHLPQAIVCANDEGAIATIICLYNHGLKVPDDILVVGFDDTESAAMFTPPISTVNRNWNHLGEAAIKHILRRIEQLPVEAKEIMPSSAVKRNSCGCSENLDSNQMSYCMNKFYQHKLSLAFNRHVRHIEELFMENEEPEVLYKKLSKLFLEEHEQEGDNFALIWEKDIIPKEIVLENKNEIKEGYNEELRLVVNIQNGQEQAVGTIKSKDLMPEGMIDEKNNIFFFAPLHYRDKTLGYYVSKNSLSMLDSRFCYDWTKGISNGIIKFSERYACDLLNRKLMELSMHDAMTGLLNRMGYRKLGYQVYIENRRNGYQTAIIFADINSLKMINDNFGHLHGDLAIKTFAEIVQKNYPSDWLAIRYGGDEYLIIGSNTTEENVRQYCESAAQGLKERSKKMKLPYELSASFGYQIIDANTKLILDEAVRQADELMYQQKVKFHLAREN